MNQHQHPLARGGFNRWYWSVR